MGFLASGLGDWEMGRRILRERGGKEKFVF